jgi:formyltetrahydrofolate hydrolase
LKKENQVLVLVGNDKRGREFLAKESQNFSVRFAVSMVSHSIRWIVKLLRKGSLSLPVLVKMTWAEIRYPFHRIPSYPQVKTNTDLLQLIQTQPIDLVILFHVGMIIRRKVLQTGVKVYNIHSARLPEYGGLMAIQRALDHGDF